MKTTSISSFESLEVARNKVTLDHRHLDKQLIEKENTINQNDKGKTTDIGK